MSAVQTIGGTTGDAVEKQQRHGRSFSHHCRQAAKQKDPEGTNIFFVARTNSGCTSRIARCSGRMAALALSNAATGEDRESSAANQTKITKVQEERVAKLIVAKKNDLEQGIKSVKSTPPNLSILTVQSRNSTKFWFILHLLWNRTCFVRGTVLL